MIVTVEKTIVVKLTEHEAFKIKEFIDEKMTSDKEKSAIELQAYKFSHELDTCGV